MKEKKQQLSSAPLLLRLITPAFSSKSGKLESSRRSFFILSTGRTATTFLAELFDSNKDIQALHEPKPSRILRMWSMASFEKRVSNAFLRSVLYRKRKKIFNSSTSAIYIESNPFLVGFTHVLSDVFEKPMVIHVVRDPRDFVKSSLNHGNDRGIKLFFNTHVPYWYPRVEKLLGLTGKQPMKVRAAAYWTLVNKYLEDYGNRNPDNYILLRYEDIFSGNQSDMKKLISLIGKSETTLLDKALSSKSINASRYNATPSWTNWSQEDCRKINELCQPLMASYGYGLETEWLDKVA